VKLLKFAVAPIALLASQAFAATWISVTTDGSSDITTYVDKDSIHRGDDGVVYFDDATDDDVDSAVAANCEEHVLYLLRLDDHVHPASNYSDWRDKGQSVTPGSVGALELQYVCANAG
jgi:hypothetical protein